MLSCALHPLAQRLAELVRVGSSDSKSGRHGLTLFYLGDGVLCGDVRILSQAFHVLQSEGPSLGLNVKLSKSELIIFDDSLPGGLARLFPQALLINEETGASRVALRGNFEFLGAAIGSDEFVA